MTTTIPVGSNGEYLGDRYERLRSCAEQLASDPGMVETESIFGAEGLRAYVGDLVEARILDGLSEHDANTVSMLVCLDFTKGPEHMAWRVLTGLTRMATLSAGRTKTRGQSLRFSPPRSSMWWVRSPAPSSRRRATASKAFAHGSARHPLG